MRRLAAALLLLGAATAAPAEANVGVAVVGHVYATPIMVVAPSAPATFVNTDLDSHDIVATEATRPPGASWCAKYALNGDPCPLFWSELIGTGVTPVLGLEDADRLVPYAFTCSIHPYMAGLVVVLPG